MNYTYLKKHPKLYKLLQQETARQSEVVNLIASENYVSPAVLEALGTIFTNKYAEGSAGHRYYSGTMVVDELEGYVQKLVLKMFQLSDRSWGVNVQPYSGSPANFSVYAALLQPGDRVLSLRLDHGGHLTHGHTASMTSKLWNFTHYHVDRNGRLDYDEIQGLAQTHKPKLIVCGGTSYPGVIDFKRFSKIAKSVGAYLMVDASHIAGLIVGGAHPLPFPYADVLTTTTHKTLRGPRGALVIARKSLADAVNKSIFPGLQGGPHLNTIFAMAVMAEEALTPGFKQYARQVVKNAKVFAEALTTNGFKIISGGTETHLILVDVSTCDMSGKQAADLLEQSGIIVNKNTIPYDSRKPWDPSGLRLGTPAVTTRGMKEKEMDRIADFIKAVLIDRVSPRKVKNQVVTFTKRFPTWKS